MSFSEIQLTADEALRFVKHSEKQQAAQAFVQQVMVAGERRNAELLAEGKAIWDELAKKYGLDLEKVAYQPRGDKLVPVQVRL